MITLKVSVIVLLLVFYKETNSSPVQREKPESRESLNARVFEIRDCNKHVSARTAFACLAYMERYKWSEKQQDCIQAVYGGCQPTKNNFNTLQECRKIATPICKMKIVT